MRDDFIFLITDAFENDECDFIIDTFERSKQIGLTSFSPDNPVVEKILTYFENTYLSKYSALQSFHVNSVKIELQKIENGSEDLILPDPSSFVSFVVYLNDVEQGGETVFPYLEETIKPQRGTLLFYPSSFTHSYQETPPTSNPKYTLSGWIGSL